MAGNIRFIETSRYDLVQDLEVVKLMGITQVGTYFTQIPMDNTLRLKKEAFKEEVYRLIEEGRPPCEVML